jgi:hypothetical protein
MTENEISKIVFRELAESAQVLGPGLLECHEECLFYELKKK